MSYYATEIDGKPKLDFSDVMIVPKHTTMSSRKEVTLTREFKFKNGKTLEATPIVASNMDTVGTISMAKELYHHGMMVAIHKHYKDDELKDFFTRYESRKSFITIGVSQEDKDRAIKMYKTFGCDMICIDVANGYMQKMLETIQEIRDKCPNAIICAGNVVTPEKVFEYSEMGADIIKLGIGPSSICKTRSQTGVGYPQLSCIMECKKEADTNGVYLMSDGGCTCPGDIAKAFCAGSDFVMIGSMLAGHDECELQFYKDDNGNKYAYVYGMSSSHAMEKHNDGMKEYRSSEGRVVKVSPKGPVKATALDILGGLRSTGTYIDADNISKFHTQKKFIRVNRQLNHYF